jgi:hypothetical protein
MEVFTVEVRKGAGQKRLSVNEGRILEIWRSCVAHGDDHPVRPVAETRDGVEEALGAGRYDSTW